MLVLEQGTNLTMKVSCLIEYFLLFISSDFLVPLSWVVPLLLFFFVVFSWALRDVSKKFPKQFQELTEPA
jgi:hypothetical protein